MQFLTTIENHTVFSAHSGEIMVENITHKGTLFAVLIRSSYHNEGIDFFTPPEFTQQLGYMKRPAGYVIKPHVHNLVSRNVCYTQEVLLIRTGKVQIDFYTEEKEFLTTKILLPGDVILLARGGHGLSMLEESEIIEVKQGPFLGAEDKVHFTPVTLRSAS